MMNTRYINMFYALIVTAMLGFVLHGIYKTGYKSGTDMALRDNRNDGIRIEANQTKNESGLIHCAEKAAPNFHQK